MYTLLQEITCELFIFLNDVRRSDVFTRRHIHTHTNGTREIFGGSLGNQQASSFFPSFNIYEIYMHINLHKRTPINITFYAHFYIFWTRVNINIKSCLLFVCVSCLFGLRERKTRKILSIILGLLIWVSFVVKQMGCHLSC